VGEEWLEIVPVVGRERDTGHDGSGGDEAIGQRTGTAASFVKQPTCFRSQLGCAGKHRIEKLHCLCLFFGQERAALKFRPSDRAGVQGVVIPQPCLDFSDHLLITATGFASFDLDASGYLTATVVTGYSTWQSANTTTQTSNLDHDNDGVSNGIEHFLGGTADTTGFTTPLPGVDNDAGTLSVTWVRHPDYPGFPGNYGTGFFVETSATLADPWTPEELVAGNVTITGNSVKYTFPAGTRNFARLKVVP